MIDLERRYETLLLEKRDRVAVVTINRPDKRNALNIKTREEGAALELGGIHVGSDCSRAC